MRTAWKSLVATASFALAWMAFQAPAAAAEGGMPTLKTKPGAVYFSNSTKAAVPAM